MPKKSKKFDRNLIVLGAGSAGLVSAYIAATAKAKVTLIEKNKMGGDCLNTGCIPSKAFIRSAKFLADTKRAKAFGFQSATVQFEFSEIMQRVQHIIATVAPHDSIQRYTQLGVECITGNAKIISPWEVAVNDQILTTRSIIIATGAQPTIPDIIGIESIDYYTSDTIWNLRTLPKKLVILGGGAIGSELAQCFARFGSQVIQIEQGARILMREDAEISALMQQRLQVEGVSILTNHTAKKIWQKDGEKILLCDDHHGEAIQIPFDTILIAVGRTANTTDFGLQELAIPLQQNNTIQVNQFLQTSHPNIFACGDVVGPFQFTHMASHQAWYATVNALFGHLKKTKIDYSIVPWATFTDPEIARVGINEQEAQQKNIPYEVTHYPMEQLDRAITDENTCGSIKVLTKPGKDTILGATIVAEHASDTICEYISAMRHKIGLNKILSTIHIYPTLAEANKNLAGNWKKTHAPKMLLNWLGKYHTWRRNDK